MKMALKLGFAICCILATFVQAYVVVRDEDTHAHIPKEIGQMDIIEINDQSPDMSRRCLQTKDPGRPEVNLGFSNDVLPTVSNEVLYQLFVAYYDATGVAPTGIERRARVLIKNRKYSGECMDLYGEKLVSLNRVIRFPCKSKGENQLVWLKIIASGHVSILFSPNLCAGSGSDYRSKVRVIEGAEWCFNLNHLFAINLTTDGKYIQFRQAANGLCLTSPDSGMDIYTDNCSEDDPRQQWQICDPTVEKCFPDPPANHENLTISA